MDFDAAKAVTASLDSLNLINELLNKESLTQEEIDSLERNKEHIRIMMANPLFVDECTPLQEENFALAIL